MSLIKLTTSDNKEYLVERKAIIRSKLIRGLLEDVGETTDAIPLPNVKSDSMEYIVEYCVHHQDDPIVENEEEVEVSPMSKENLEIDPWDYQFAKKPKDELIALILAANYLDIKPLITACCKVVANMMRGKTAEQVRADFGFKNDFTPEEEAEIRKENVWIDNQ